jgi:hypothetical protein
VGFFSSKKRTAAVIATGWIGDTIACTAAATSLYESGYQVTFFLRWPQLRAVLENDKRFTVRIYPHLKIIKLLKYVLELWFDKVVWEPKTWSYQEPFTSEIRRLAGCDPRPEYELFLGVPPPTKDRHQSGRPLIALGRDFYKRAYGRNVDELTAMLSEFADIEWIGLSPEKNSKHGRQDSLLSVARRINSADIFMGPEGGLLWLAAGIEMPCVYFSENIDAVAKQNGFLSLDDVLGSKNYFSDKGMHIALPSMCSNQDALAVVKSTLDHVIKKQGRYAVDEHASK